MTVTTVGQLAYNERRVGFVMKNEEIQVYLVFRKFESNKQIKSPTQ